MTAEFPMIIHLMLIVDSFAAHFLFAGDIAFKVLVALQSICQYGPIEPIEPIDFFQSWSAWFRFSWLGRLGRLTSSRFGRLGDYVLAIILIDLGGFLSPCSKSSGWHSGQGSIFQGILSEIQLWKMVWSNLARLLAENFGARLSGTVIRTDCQLVWQKHPGVVKLMNIESIDKMRVQKSRGVIFWKPPKRRR